MSDVACVMEMNDQYDLQTGEVMKAVLREDSNCVDVGCHKGAFLREALRLSPKGTHFAFEPLPNFYDGLCKVFRRCPNVRIVSVALSDTKGQSSFQHVISHPGYSGLRRRAYDYPDERVQEITVEMDAMDNVIPDIPIHFVKVDVEGGEMGVFQGASKLLSRSRPVVVFEHGLGAADYYGVDPGDLYDLLVVRCGLRISLMSRWLESGGQSSLTRSAFATEFWEHRNYYFMAHP